MSAPSDLKLRILAAAREEPAPARPAVARRFAAVLTAASAVALAEFLITGGVRTGGRPAGFVALTSAGWLLPALAVSWLALRRGSMLGRPTAQTVALALVAPCAPLLFTALGNALWPATRTVVAGHPGLVCFDLSLSLGAWPLVGLAFLRRGSDPVHPAATGAAFGAMTGTWSGLLVNLTCRFTDFPHALIGHVAPALAQVLVGALLGQVLVALRGMGSARLGAVLGGAAGAWLAVTVDLRIQYGCPDHLELRELAYLALGALGGAAAGWLVSRLLSRQQARGQLG